MLRTFSIQTPVFTLLYRGYDIEVSRAPAGWRVGVYPRTADLPILRCGEAYACDQDAAVIEAKRRVDGKHLGSPYPIQISPTPRASRWDPRSDGLEAGGLRDGPLGHAFVVAWLAEKAKSGSTDRDAPLPHMAIWRASQGPC